MSNQFSFYSVIVYKITPNACMPCRRTIGQHSDVENRVLFAT